MTSTETYDVGIDVGSHSIGFAAISLDDSGSPVKILNAKVHLHDSGIGADGKKTAETRLAQSGVARRMRRLHSRRKKRLRALDEWIVAQGWPIVDLGKQDDPYLPWRVRAALVDEATESANDRGEKLSVAVRHMARHRGWRSSWERVESLYEESPDSEFLVAMKTRVREAISIDIGEDETPAQVVVKILQTDRTRALRGPNGLQGGKLHQSDNARELMRIAERQGLDQELLRQMLQLVFKSESPRGSARGRVGKDCLPGKGHLPRASKADPEFQRYRMVSILTNLRIRTPGIVDFRRLTVDEIRRAYTSLLNVSPVDDVSWSDLAAVLDVERSQLSGTAAVTADGERASSRPPLDTTDRTIRTSKVRALVTWWQDAGADVRAAFVDLVTNGGQGGLLDSATAAATEFLATLDDADLVRIDGLNLARGRASYSAESLRELTEYMLDTGADVHEARMSVFGVEPRWAPPAEPIGTPVGNPAVDRVLKEVARWLDAAVATWGVPRSVQIEHVRDGFMSEATARELDRANNRRAQRNRELEIRLLAENDDPRRVRPADRMRYRAVVRQNCQCLYCGEPITYSGCEMDHIVPRRGVGSTNRSDNLAAVCRRCNASKSNTPFAVWAAHCGIEGVSVKDAKERTRHWVMEPGETRSRHLAFVREVVARLSRTTEDPEIDGRSMESIAWMANELRHRVSEHFRSAGDDVRVAVYRGQLTAEARRASGFEGKIPFLRIDPASPKGKTRLDRRHHAVDAMVIAMMNQSVCTTLVERTDLRLEQQLLGQEETWRQYAGANPGNQVLYYRWRDTMDLLAVLVRDAFEQDRIVVDQNRRLRLGDGAAHDATIKPLTRVLVSEAMSPQLIDRASSPALWCALTRQPDFDPGSGLPASPYRGLVVNGHHVTAEDHLEFFPSPNAMIAVRGGCADVGSTIHHARVFRFPRGKSDAFGMLRVFTTDLLRHQHEDLFAVPLPPQSISMRTADRAVRLALESGVAESIGWLVVGDQLQVENRALSGAAAEVVDRVPAINLWRLDGFYSPSRLRLRPQLLAAEGLELNAPDEFREVLDKRGWLPSLNVVFGAGDPTVIRRDVLGRPRLTSEARLPTCWQVPG